MRGARLVGLLFLTGVGAALAGPTPRTLEGAETLLRAQRYRLAADAYRRILDHHPGDPHATAGLGRAFAGLGNCTRAIGHFEEVRPTPGWTAPVATAHAACLARRGDRAGALASLEEAVQLDPDHRRAWYQLALVAGARGETLRADEALERLRAMEEGENMVALVEAWRALEHGEEALAPALDALERALRDDAPPAARVQLHLIDGLRWLDLDDPAAAVESLRRGVLLDQGHVRAASWQAEAHRRLGLLDEAERILDRSRLGPVDTPLRAAVRARVAVDRGDPVAARALLEAQDARQDPDWLAARWYLARATGEPLEPWASRWRRRVRAEGRTLEQLVPLERRTAGQ